MVYIMTPRELQQQLKDLRKTHSPINPDASFVTQSKKTLLARISSTKEHAAPAYSLGEKLYIVGRMLVSQKTARMVRVTALMCMVVTTTVAGWTAGVSASSKSMPGDALYSVKLATEKTQIMVASATGDKETETQLHLESAKRRTTELHQMDKEPKKVKKVVARLKKSVASANETFKELKAQDSEKAKVVAKEVTQKTEDISKTLKAVVVDTAQDAREVTHTPDEKQEELVLTKEVVEIRHDIDLAELSAIAVLDSEDAKDVLEDRVEDMIEDAQEVKEAFDLVAEQVTSTSTAAVASSTVGITEEDAQTQEVVTTSTPAEGTVSEDGSLQDAEQEEVGDTEELSLEDMEEVAEQIDESIERMQEIAEEVQQLLDEGSIDAAIEKTKDVQEITQETDDRVLEVQEQIIEEEQKEQREDVQEGESEPVEAQEGVEEAEQPQEHTTDAQEHSHENQDREHSDTDPIEIEGDIEPAAEVVSLEPEREEI